MFALHADTSDPGSGLCRAEVMSSPPLINGGHPCEPRANQKFRRSRTGEACFHGKRSGSPSLNAGGVRRGPRNARARQRFVYPPSPPPFRARIFEMSAAMQNSCPIIIENRHTTESSAKLFNLCLLMIPLKGGGAR